MPSLEEPQSNYSQKYEYMYMNICIYISQYIADKDDSQRYPE